jgi:putative membrane protein
MRDPFATPLGPSTNGPTRPEPRPARVFLPETLSGLSPTPESLSADDQHRLIPPKRQTWIFRLALWAGGLLLSLGIGLALDSLVRAAFVRWSGLGYFGLTLVILFGLAVFVLLIHELFGLARLSRLRDLQARAATALDNNAAPLARRVVTDLDRLYAARADLARARAELAADRAHILDGADLIRVAEGRLMHPLDQGARALTAAAARRVALVTAISPRALVDLAYVLFESLRLGRDIMQLYGARPGLWGTVRLFGAVLGHLAVTGGLVLTDGVVEQMLGQGMAARVSARLGEGVVNALMTVRVGIAALSVVRPLPFIAEKPPAIREFLPDLLSVLKRES